MRVRKLIILIAITFLFSGCVYHGEIARTPSGMSLYSQTVAFNRVRYIPLLRFCNYYDLDWDWDLVSQKIELKYGKNILVLRPNSSLILVNEKPVELDYPIEYKSGTAYIPVKTAVFVSEDVFGLKKWTVPVAKYHRINTVVIDPGHGGKDPGAVNRYGIKEKNIVLDVSKRLKKQLEKKGLKVLLTRQRDVFIPLRKRAAFANKKDADLFISVHANAFKYSRVSGFEVYYLSEATDDSARALAAAENAVLKFEEGEIAKGKKLPPMTTLWDMELTENRRVSRELAYYICNISSDSLRTKKRGVKGARFVVLKDAMMPAVLVEVGFLTNRREGSRLNKGYYREEIAKAVARSILVYKKEYERTDGFSR